MIANKYDGIKNGLPVYVYRLASLQGELQKELGTIPPERRYQRMSVPLPPL